MLPVENILGAALVGGSGYYLGGHMSLTPQGGAAVRYVSTLMALAILAYPFFR